MDKQEKKKYLINEIIHSNDQSKLKGAHESNDLDFAGNFCKKPKYLFFKRITMRLNSKIKTALIKLNHQKTQFKRAKILKTRQEKLQRSRINYIPLCSDEDWEAMAAFYQKNSSE